MLNEITFGIEIETTVPRGVNFQIGGYHVGTPIYTAPTFNGAHWKAERDGSIVAGRAQACEFVSPILKGEAGIKHLLEFLQWLESIGAKVNRSCGLHIHVGVDTLPHHPEFNGPDNVFFNVLARTVSRHTTALYAQTGTLAREQGHYCSPLGTDYQTRVNAAGRRWKKSTNRDLPNNRYQILNLAPVASKRTVEFRCFAGTTNPEKILVHLWSVLTLCAKAAASEYLPDWQKPSTVTGTARVKNLFKLWGTLESETFTAHRAAMQAAALRMAEKYDAARGEAAAQLGQQVAARMAARTAAAANL